ncbi:MAG: radical SAM protein, partial [Candidatus Woesearchaeota archaeon]
LVADGYYNLYPRKKFSKEGFILTSRGCAHHCTFCSPMCRVSFGKRYRYHSVNYVVDWVQRLKEQGVDYVTFMDDDFTFSRSRVMELCKAIPPVRWMAHARVDDLDFEMLKVMKNAGCELLKIGVESGSPSVLKNIRKTNEPEIWPEKAVEVGQMSRKLGIDVVAMFLVGVPGEKSEDIEMTKSLIEKMDPYLIQTARYTDYQKGGYHYGHSTDSKRAEQYLYRSFYLRWRFLRNHTRFLPYHLHNLSSSKKALPYLLNFK